MSTLIEWILGSVILFSSLGVILAQKPVHASLSFLLTLLALAGLYLELSAEFISVMQVLVYAGAILVIFIFVIVLFQDAHEQMKELKAQSKLLLLAVSGCLLLFSIFLLARQFIGFHVSEETLPKDYGTVQSLGRLLYIDFFFPFEAVILLFLVAIVGALYTGKRYKHE